MDTDGFVVVDSNNISEWDKSIYTEDERRKYIINKLHTVRWKKQLNTTQMYLDKMMEQVGGLDNMKNGDIHKCDFPWPMFEIVNRDHSKQSLDKGFPLNFHTLYAEAEILKCLIN